MDIVIAIDRNYITQCIVLVYSIISANRNTVLDFYVLSEGLSEKDRQFIESHFNNTSFHFIQVDLKLIKPADFSSSEYLTVASYYRLLIPVLLPENIKKVLYLDCDILVMGSLSELWETDISSYSTAVTIDAGSNDIRHFNRLNISTDFDYFNAGMLLINLEYWRENEIQRKTLKFIEENPKACKQHDQDALNKILLGTVKYVSVKYNFIERYFLLNTGRLLVKPEFLKDIEDSVLNIIILHYAGSEKPWHNECVHPYKNLWLLFYKKIFGSELKKFSRYKGIKRIKAFLKILLTKIHLINRYRNLRNEQPKDSIPWNAR